MFTFSAYAFLLLRNQTEAEFMNQLDILVNETNIQLSLLWEFDLKHGPREEWRCGPDNDRWYMFLEVAKTNKKFQKEYDAMLKTSSPTTATATDTPGLRKSAFTSLASFVLFVFNLLLMITIYK